MTVGDRIRNTRIEKGLLQSELAERAGYSDKTSISKIENAGNYVTMKQVNRIAEALGVSSSYLMGWEDAPAEIAAPPEPDPVSTPAPMSGYISTAEIPNALDMYEKYKNATPEVRAAIELLLKSPRSDA